MFSLLQMLVKDDENYSMHVEKKLEYVWSLKRNLLFSHRLLKSKCFRGVNDKQSWFVRLRLGDQDADHDSDEDDDSDADDISSAPPDFKVQLCLKKKPDTAVPAKFTFVLKSGDREISKDSGCFLFVSNDFISRACNITIPCAHKTVKHFQLHVTVYVEIDSTQILVTKKISQLKKMQDLLYSLRKGDCSDIVIKVDGVEINCHRSILSCRSCYFDVMFKSGLNESKENFIEISDFDYETIKMMIDFLYTFECPKISAESAMKLLEAADKYQIPDLKDICEMYVLSEINASNAMDVLLHAQVHSAEKIKKQAMDFMWKNSSEFMDPEQYENLLTRPELLRDLVLAKMNLNSKE